MFVIIDDRLAGGNYIKDSKKKNSNNICHKGGVPLRKK